VLPIAPSRSANNRYVEVIAPYLTGLREPWRQRERPRAQSGKSSVARAPPPTAPRPGLQVNLVREALEHPVRAFVRGQETSPVEPHTRARP